LRANVKRLAGDSAACPIEVLAGDVFSHMTGWGPASFDLVFIDPPFAAQWFDRALDAACRVVSPQGFIYLESDQPFAHERLQVYREMQAGTVQARLLRPCGHE
jgi:16S rRNA (guanine966-N2)-methyltransferase